jgi:redox-sensitive bicupin YhaK (pirin superfamily)
MLERVIDGRRRDLGGFEVERILPAAGHRMVGPFIFLDHMGPAKFAAGHGIDVRPHPHIGLSTVTYLFEGNLFHRDSLGSAQSIEPFAVNWMTAGRGIVHSERTAGETRKNVSALHGIQAWVALPDELEETAPAFSHHPPAALPVLREKGINARLIAGTAYGLTNKVKTHSPMFYLDVTLDAGARLALPPEHAERAIYIVSGALIDEGQRYEAGRMLVFASGGEPLVVAETRARLMLLGGAPLGPRYIWWNLVSSRPDRIRQARDDWQSGRMSLPPGDDHEFIPAPDSPDLP